jgi:hypothetical protein
MVNKLMDKETEKRIMETLREENNQLLENLKKLEEKRKEQKTYEVFRSLEDRIDMDDQEEF